MFEPEWMEYFEREAPISYYCVIFLGYLGKTLFYFAYVVLLMVLFVPIFMIYSSTKEIKIRLKQDKQHKKRTKQMDAENSINQKMYFDRLDKSIKKKKKHH